jgi:uncharacterized protein (DUF1330 family)
MPAYVVVNVEVRDPEGYREYTAQTPASIAAHGGRFIVRGGDVEVLEGDWRPSRLVILEFPSVEAAREWYFSPDYQKLKELREANAETQLVLTSAGALPG